MSNLQGPGGPVNKASIGHSQVAPRVHSLRHHALNVEHRAVDSLSIIEVVQAWSNEW